MCVKVAAEGGGRGCYNIIVLDRSLHSVISSGTQCFRAFHWSSEVCRFHSYLDL